MYTFLAPSVYVPKTHPARSQGHTLAGMGVNGFGGGSGGEFASLREHHPFPGPCGSLGVKWIQLGVLGRFERL